MDTRPYFFASRAFQRQKRGTGDEAKMLHAWGIKDLPHIKSVCVCVVCVHACVCVWGGGGGGGGGALSISATASNGYNCFRYFSGSACPSLEKNELVMAN